MTVSRPLLGMIWQILSRLAELLQQLRCRPRPRPFHTPRNLPYDCAWLYHPLYRSTTCSTARALVFSTLRRRRGRAWLD